MDEALIWRIFGQILSAMQVLKPHQYHTSILLLIATRNATSARVGPSCTEI